MFRSSRQGRQEILACAASMLRPGGRMVYSTCTFAPEENEGTISRFLEQHPQFHIVPVKKYPGMADGVAAWTKHPAAEIGDTIRLFPHHLHGEGHFVAVLEKEGTVSENYRGYCANGEEKPLAKGEAKAYLAGLQEFLGKIPADDAERAASFLERMGLPLPDGHVCLAQIKFRIFSPPCLSCVDRMIATRNPRTIPRITARAAISNVFPSPRSRYR